MSCECHLWAWHCSVKTYNSFSIEFSSRIEKWSWVQNWRSVVPEINILPQFRVRENSNIVFLIVFLGVNKISFLFFRAANLLMLSFGSTIGWLSPALPLLQSEASPLSSGPMTIQQISWTGSLLSVGALAGNILGGYLMIRFGSKMILMLLAVPQLVFSLQCMNEPCVFYFLCGLWLAICL